MAITLADVERIIRDAETAPDIEPQNRELNKQEAVREAKPAIEALRAKGYSWEEVAQFLAERNLSLTVATLKSYVRRAGGSKPKAKKERKQRQPAATPAQQPDASPKIATPAAQKPAKAPAKAPEGQKATPQADAPRGGFNTREDSEDI